ncbi:hypothetical protein SAMN05192589_12221 [Paracidovorax valerianellae]|uniref:Uncharacterized protein n=1 Tax=Paracidovorax valerianellae TaxID=187868 RepID=A0A1G7E8F3_9BURK|nr:hypothetical protein [Paracidovorax valerianellae]SDE59962.1 hypothetical protein SAMN05192589_12221 [Paracidovorax valerianellae]
MRVDRPVPGRARHGRFPRSAATAAALCAVVFCASALMAPLAHAAADANADADADTPLPFKLTTGLYHVAGGGLPAGPGLDVNLRYTRGDDHWWIGAFRSPALDFSMPRAGWDRTVALGDWRVLPSLQIASGGFVGGSVAVETGTTWVVGAGLGRTNLRNYANLNFDPNDAYTVYGSHRWSSGDTLALQLVRDNRQNPDQQNVHLVWRSPQPGGERLTVDLLAKQGTVDGRFQRRAGLSVGYDWAEWFVRAAWDPLVNFTPQSMWRLSTGVRF